MKKIKTLLAAFLVLIAAGIMVACSSNSDGADLDTSTKATPLFDDTDVTIPADDVVLSNGVWVFKWVNTSSNSSTRHSYENNYVDYSYISNKLTILLNFSVSNGTRTVTSGKYKSEQVLDDENKAKLQQFFTENNLNSPNDKWEGNKFTRTYEQYTYAGNMTNAINSADKDYVSVKTNKNKTCYIISFSTNDNYYFAKQ